MNPAFWTLLDDLGASSSVVIDRPKGSAHPRFPENIYPYDYGYLSGTTSGDGQGIDVWLGGGDVTQLSAVLVSADLKKRDAELKLLLGCNPAEQQVVVDWPNGYPSFQCLLVVRPS
ncbi:inorganic pyrophosphatase [Deinococcus sp.]|uniref:inorganic pyrophosphatase n=1 Tax=Deinococcus sp. TaxID=47478 RepID=UPI003C79F500